MITSKKFWTHRDNKVPVWDLPGEYYINLREPWQPGDPGTSDTFVCGILKKNHDTVYAKLKVIVERHGGTIAEKINCYGGIHVENMTDEAMEEICGLENVYNISRNVSMLPPESHQYFNGKSDVMPESYRDDLVQLAINLNKHGAL